MTKAKTIWLKESLEKHGYDYEKMLTGFLMKAAKGDKLAYDMAALLIKMIPHLAQAPKAEAGTTQIDTLVINKYEGRKEVIAPVVDAEVVEPLSGGEKSNTPAV